MKPRYIILIGIWCLLLAGSMVQAASASGMDHGRAAQLNTNADAVAAAKAAVAYAAEWCKARMDGAIQYITTISPSGATVLQQDREKFLANATDAQAATDVKGVRDAAREMKANAREFTADTKEIMEANDGNRTRLRTAVRASVDADSATLDTLKDAVWVARETARLHLYEKNDERRNAVLANLSSQGIDVSKAQAIEDQIQAQGTALRDALAARDRNALRDANARLQDLTREFNNAIRTLRQDDDHPWIGRWQHGTCTCS